jgi:hypothetical protein
MSKKTITVWDYENDCNVELPTKYEVCQNCHGNGTHVNRALDGNGLTYDDIQEWGGDEFMEDYMGGAYDVRCDECRGDRVVLAIDYDRCTDAQIALYEDDCHSQECMDAEYAAERAMGC